MRTRRLGGTDLELTTVGLGTWAIGGSNWRFGWGAQDDAEAVAALLRGIELGINWIDTAAVYGRGHAEELCGRALAALPPEQRPIVATKCGRIVQPDGSVRGDLSRASVHAECEASLRRLGVEVIDLYQMHWPDPDPQIEEGWAAMAELVQRGLVRHIGVSNFDVAQMRRAAAIAPVASLQPPYSMLARGVEAAALPHCAEHDIGVVAYSPLGKGLLTGAFSPQRAAGLADDDHRSRDPEFAAPRLDANLALVRGLEPIAARNDITLTQLAIRWVLRRPEVTSAIVGVRRPAQAEGLADAGQHPLSSEDCTAVESLLQTRSAALQQ